MHCKKALGLIPGSGVFLWWFWVFQCLCGFSPGSLASSHSLKTSTLSLWMYNANGCDLVVEFWWPAKGGHLEWAPTILRAAIENQWMDKALTSWGLHWQGLPLGVTLVKCQSMPPSQSMGKHSTEWSKEANVPWKTFKPMQRGLRPAQRLISLSKCKYFWLQKSNLFHPSLFWESKWSRCVSDLEMKSPRIQNSHFKSSRTPFTVSMSGDSELQSVAVFALSRLLNSLASCELSVREWSRIQGLASARRHVTGRKLGNNMHFNRQVRGGQGII